MKAGFEARARAKREKEREKEEREAEERKEVEERETDLSGWAIKRRKEHDVCAILINLLGAGPSLTMRVRCDVKLGTDEQN